MNYISPSSVRKFLNRSLLKMYVGATTGFLLGLKLCDKIFYDPQKYEIIKEEMEEEFWKIHGKSLRLIYFHI